MQWLRGQPPNTPDEYRQEYKLRQDLTYELYLGKPLDHTNWPELLVPEPSLDGRTHVQIKRDRLRQRLSALRPVLKISHICRETGLSRYVVETIMGTDEAAYGLYNTKHHELLLMWLAKHESRLLATMEDTIERRKQGLERQRRYMQRKKGETRWTPSN